MQTVIHPEDIDNHIKNVFELLRKQEYAPLGAELSREERKQLFEFFYEYKGIYGEAEEKFYKYYYNKTISQVESLNKEAYEKANDEIKMIVTKCGVDPRKIFVLDTDRGSCYIDDNILNAMYNKGNIEIGDYYIEAKYDYPVDRDSEQILRFQESVQDDRYSRAKDGEATFSVYKNVDGKREKIYYHSDGINFGGLICFKDYQIGGNFGIGGFSFDVETGMMYKDSGRAKCINELMPFFAEFEEVLSKNLGRTLR